MRLLFEMDSKDYREKGTIFYRPSARGIIIKGNKIMMVQSLKHNYYKFPGGGIEKGESNIDALIREVAEESGLIVVADSIREFGRVHRVTKGHKEDILVQENYYYFCDTLDQEGRQNLDDYEREDQFVAKLVYPQIAIEANRSLKTTIRMSNERFEREARVLQLLIDENYFADK